MMDDDDDDMYGSEEEEITTKDESAATKQKEEDSEDDDSEEESSEEDSDIEIVTEAKKGSVPEPPSQAQRPGAAKGTTGASKTEAQSEDAKAPDAASDRAGTKRKASPPLKPGSSYPPVHASKIDVDANPIYDPAGKPITDVDMDEDFDEDDKAWRRPGTDLTDFFNYGFDEFTWASYCLKQSTLRKEGKDAKKQVEELQSFLGMPGAGPPGGPAAPSAMGGAAGMNMPGDMPPEMQQMMSQMVAQGMDPTQMDFNTFMQMMGQSGQPGAGPQGYGMPQGGNQQQMGGFGYGGHGGGGGRPNRGRGQRW